MEGGVYWRRDETGARFQIPSNPNLPFLSQELEVFCCQRSGLKCFSDIVANL
jgi:hypothetical protein